jgi:hypothetical protein
MAFTEEEIRIIQARRAARAARAAREAAGLPPEEPVPPKKRRFRPRRALAKLLLIAFMGGLATPAAAMFWRYGTFSPCSALTKTLHEALGHETGAQALPSAQPPNPETSAQARFPDVDRGITPLSPTQCTKVLIEFERSDKQSFIKAFLAQPSP